MIGGLAYVPFTPYPREPSDIFLRARITKSLDLKSGLELLIYVCPFTCMIRKSLFKTKENDSTAEH